MEVKDWIGIGAFLISVISLTLAIIALRRTTIHNRTIRQYASAAPDIALSSQINQARMMITTIALKIADITKGKTDDKLTQNEQRQI